MKRKKILYSLIIILIIILLGGTFFIKNSFHNNIEEEKKTDVTNNKYEENTNEGIYENRLPGLRELYQNNDIIAELEVPAINLVEPIVKGTDNKYYLNHDIQGQTTIKGAAFMDYRISDVDNAKQINIYGHNSDKDLDKFPFSKLEKYRQEDFFKNNPDVFLKTDNKIHKYKIFTVSIVSKDSDEHMLVLAQDEKFLNHVEAMRSNVLFDTGEVIKKEDNIIVLQTCLLHPDQLLLIIAKEYFDN